MNDVEEAESVKAIKIPSLPTEKEVEEHSADIDPENPKDFIDVYLAAIGKDSAQDLNMLDLTGCIWDFFMAGTETSSTTLKWIVLYLVLHQNVQDRYKVHPTFLTE